MIAFFRFDTNEEKHALLDRARNVALTAIQKYDIAWKKIQFIQLSDTITYKLEATPQTRYLLRIHSDRCSRDEIASELVFLQMLHYSQELTVPTGVASKDGSYVIEVETEAGYCRPYVTVMRWVDGEHAEELTDSQVYRTGAMMAQLHVEAARYVPSSDFTRPAWGNDSFRREFKKLERYYPRFLSKQGLELYQKAADKVVAQVAGLDQQADTYGLIHADLHTGNVVYNGEEPRPIDFGRCGYGYYLYDLAGALLGLGVKQREQFITGYESVKKLPSGYLEQVECFFIIFMIENYCHHAPNPDETSNLIAEQSFAQAFLQAFLQDSPFLFRRVNPAQV